jgi:hypothetical protein
VSIIFVTALGVPTITRGTAALDAGSELRRIGRGAMPTSNLAWFQPVTSRIAHLQEGGSPAQHLPDSATCAAGKKLHDLMLCVPPHACQSQGVCGVHACTVLQHLFPAGLGVKQWQLQGGNTVALVNALYELVQQQHGLLSSKEHLQVRSTSQPTHRNCCAWRKRSWQQHDGICLAGYYFFWPQIFKLAEHLCRLVCGHMPRW